LQQGFSDSQVATKTMCLPPALHILCVPTQVSSL